MNGPTCDPMGLKIRTSTTGAMHVAGSVICASISASPLLLSVTPSVLDDRTAAASTHDTDGDHLDRADGPDNADWNAGLVGDKQTTHLHL